MPDAGNAQPESRASRKLKVQRRPFMSLIHATRELVDRRKGIGPSLSTFLETPRPVGIAD